MASSTRIRRSSRGRASVLDPAQLEAVAHGVGPCLVLAGPGSGKTRVIVERYLSLLAAGVGADAQLVLTYTRRAAEEMRARVEQRHGTADSDPPLTNYHSFGFRVVRDWGWLEGVAPTLRIADSAERWLHTEAVLAELRPRLLWNPLRPQDIMDQLLKVIADAKQELVSPPAYARWAEQRLKACTDPAQLTLLQRHEEVAAVYAALDARYRRLGVFDHDDCILYAERLLREHEVVRQGVARRIQYVMVDEYQDTNVAQARLVETLVEEHRNLLVVADDDQSIYKFRGASRANLERFQRTYPEHRTIVLTNNYRSTRQIVAATRAIISSASEQSRIPKDLVAERGEGAPVEVWAAPDERSEALAVAQHCRELIDAGLPPRQIAWLFRRHAEMRAAMHALRECGVPYQVSGGRGFFQEREVKDTFALLAAAADPEDTQAVLRCLHLPAWNVSGRGRLALAALARDSELPLCQLILDADVSGLDEADLASARRCIEDVMALHAQSQREDVRDVFFEAMERSHYAGVLAAAAAAERLQISANLSKLADLLETFADWSDDRRVGTALRYLEVLRDSREAAELAPVDALEDGVQLLTAHGAKALEWPVVIVAHCSADEWRGHARTAYDLQLPDELVPEPAPPGDGVLDEERRLFYVAATRARDRLILSWARRYGHRYSDQVPTPFLQPLQSGGSAAVAHRSLPAATAVPSRRPRTPAVPVPADPSLGVSDLRAFRACPRQFAYRALWRLPVRSSVQSWYGTLVHDVLRTAGLRRLAGTPVDGDTVARLWAQAWDVSRGPKGEHPDLRALGEEQLRRYVTSPAWLEARIQAVEDRVALDVSSARIVGRLDRIDDNGTDLVVVDYKTSAPRAAEALRSDLQVRAYAVGAATRAERDSIAVELHYLQSGQVTRLDFDASALATAHRHLSAVSGEILRAWGSADFPARPSAFQCSRCPYRTVCDEGREAVAQADG